ncbi:MAG: FkbM family methyltransferase [Brevundimonas sp.]|nr:MAG: FkbM family methyltransferase [Brevundimonas sp.]
MLVDDRLRLWIDLADTVVSMGCLAGNYEPQETRFVLQTLAPGDVFVDIGANLGWFTILAADRVGSAGQVHAFEPGSLTRGLLQRSVDDNGFGDRVQIHSVALGMRRDRGTCCRTLPPVVTEGYMAPAGDAGSAGFAGQDVDVRPLDALAIDRRVKLIKMDVEGSEPLVLRGAQNLIARDRPLILAEVYDELLRLVSGTDAAGFRRQVRDMGYRIHAIRDGAVGEVVTDDAVIGIDRPANVILVPA